ncbi:MAG: hypothetical protein IJF78_11080 [Clostridia bacterium]|nr:hypothetical protein [Clostridia bacterium]
MTKRIFSLLLAALMLTSAVACSETAAPETSAVPGTINPETEASETEETETEITLNIPKEDNGGRTFQMLVPTEKAYEFVEESTGEIVNDAVYGRSLIAEDNFNIKFQYQYATDVYGPHTEYNKIITNSVMASESGYDIVTGFVVLTLPLFLNGNFLDYTQQDDLNLENPWWIYDQYDALNIDGALYTLMGDVNLSVYKDCCVVYFNKTVLDNYHLEDPYTLVRENKWVIDKFIEMGAAAVKDLNGDGAIDRDNDALASYLGHVPFRTFQTALEVPFFEKDENGRFVVTPINDHMVSAYEKAYKVRSEPGFIMSTKSEDPGQFAEILANDRSLFYLSFLYALEGDVMRNMESDFGLVPYPKYDEQQERFKTQIGTSSNSNYLAVNCPDPGLSCRVLETLAYHSMKDVVPAYYTVALENKYTRDTDVPEMLTIIRDGMTMSFDFAMSLSFAPSPTNMFQSVKEGELASQMASATQKWSATLETFYADKETAEE